MTRRYVDIWNDDDPAVQRVREALTLAAQRRAEPVQDAPGRIEPVEVESTPAPEPVATPEESSARQGRIQELIARVRAGDLSAVDTLRRLLDR